MNLAQKNSTGPIWDDHSWTPLPSLNGDVRTDVCVVGLGGSGLSALQELQALGVNAVGVDAREVGANAAGRNGGFFLAGLADFFHETVEQYGRELASGLYHETVNEIQRQVCEWPEINRLTGSLRIAADEEEIENCRKHLTALHECGFPAEWYLGPEGEGLLLPTDGVMQPLARVRAIAKKLRSQNVALYERSPVQKLSPGEVVTDAGVVHCDSIIVAVDGSLDKIFPELSPRVRTARLQMLGTAPELDVNIPRPIYWRHGYEYWQQLPNRSIVIGGFRDHPLEGEWTHDTEPTGYIQSLLENFLRQQLKVRAPITHRWAATVAYTDNGLPVMEPVRPKIWAVGAYCGTGNIVGMLCARAVARQVCGKRSEWSELLAQAKTRLS